MATSTETIEIRRRGRRRLIGAVAIVVLLVVFVPMLLDSEPHRTASEPAMQIPPKENAPPLPAPAPAKAAPASASAQTVAPESSSPGPAAKLAVVPESSNRGPTPTTKQAAPRLEGFAVQVGAFRDEETLEQARAKLAAAGIVHYTERLGDGAHALTRLRAGPFPSREAAESARASLKRASLDGQVVSLP
jgi:DedD protein